MTFITCTSAHGTNHQSKTEADAADRLIPLGIRQHDHPLPATFKDKDGVECTGRSDFLDPVFGILIETKASHLNSKTSKATAEKASTNLEKSIRDGFVKRDSAPHRWKTIESGWNHSAAQIAAKQQACFNAGQPYLLLFAEKPDSDTLKRLTKYNILWVKEGDHDFQQLMCYRKLHSTPGITVTALPIKDWQIKFASS